ncbi:hypothetical protein [Paenibacillus mendelii]|uniref:Uncharacterized protein n=1 Tax=Paenibacillus mendelii TaxID=206163 RepID=A0ABV6J6Z5_9BACL|nr:hypothetical protein [Paenibacillus mendelii]MCQ6561064.1 hypothetical protein [Paenibacillus mendelii]
MPSYRHAAYAGESIVIENDGMRLEIHKRPTGWGWGEIYSPDGKFAAVIEHFGELMLRDQEMPMRLEADTIERESGAFGERLTLRVKSLVVQDKLRGTSFDSWIRYPFQEPCMEGEVVLTLPPGKAPLQYQFKLIAKANLFAKYCRGPWIKAGADSYGSSKTDGILPGVEWLEGDEWSSGSDWFKDPWALRTVPHPNKVSIPVMAISHEGLAVGLSWNPNSDATRWFNYRIHRQQPVFASPNFIDRMNNHLMGLMIPDASGENGENQVEAAAPLELHPDQVVEFEGEVFLSEGSSLDAVTDWVKRNELPEPPAPRWPLEDALDRIANAYANRFWVEGKGFGFAQHPGSGSPAEPRFAEAYLATRSDRPAAAALKQRVDWCREQTGYRKPHHRLGIVGAASTMAREKLLEQGNKLMSHQREDGAFPFDPDGRHYMKDDFVVAREYLEPMGLAGDTALDITITPAADLIALYEQTGEESFKEAAIRALEFCMPMRRPEGGDFWETPLHSPNLLAAGHAANAYAMAFRAFGDERYKAKAVYWLRCLIPFTHLWQPKDVPMMYNTKPCLCSSDWYFANWVRDHVQWEVLETFASSEALGIDWNEWDTEIDWHRFQEGITVAALRWMVDHRDNQWRPHNLPWTLDLYNQGLLDDCYADTHNSVTGLYGGMVIPPDPIAVNLLAILNRK